MTANMRECVVLEVQPNGAIHPTIAKVDGQGGVYKDEPPKKTWITQAEDWGTCIYKDGKVFSDKGRELPAIMAYSDRTEPILLRREPNQAKTPIQRIQHPIALRNYLDGDFLRQLGQVAVPKQSGMGMPDWVKKVPAWAWITGFILLAVVYTFIKNGNSFAGLV